MERWVLGSSFGCAGCAFLASVGVFPAGLLPAQLHPNCRCSPSPVDTAGMSAAARVRLGLEASRNADAFDAIMAEARGRMRSVSPAMRAVLG